MLARPGFMTQASLIPALEERHVPAKRNRSRWSNVIARPPASQLHDGL
jgi:hypothetical protein